MNKPRMIDANELYKVIEENSYMLVDAINSKDKGMFLIGIKEAIDKTPTAYDLDKVVEQLEAMKALHESLIDRDRKMFRIAVRELSDYKMCIEICLEIKITECILATLVKVIEIVKGGQNA